MSITEHTAVLDGFKLHYLETSGLPGSPLVVFVHGWPELAISWRHQLQTLGALGYRCIAPDMPGYGRTDCPVEVDAYSARNVSAILMKLLDSLDVDKAVFVGHDWGAPVVWSISLHYPSRVLGVAGLAVPYTPPSPVCSFNDYMRHAEKTTGRLPENMKQFDYFLYYEQAPDEATATFEKYTSQAVRAIFRAAGPEAKPITDKIRQMGGWGPLLAAVPDDLAPDARVLDATDYAAYVAALTRNGFHGPTCWYLNDKDNWAYALEGVKKKSPGDPHISPPALMICCEFDRTCTPDLSASLHEYAPRLTKVTLPCGHWVQQELPVRVSACLVNWLATEVKAVPSVSSKL